MSIKSFVCKIRGLFVGVTHKKDVFIELGNVIGNRKNDCDCISIINIEALNKYEFIEKYIYFIEVINYLTIPINNRNITKLFILYEDEAICIFDDNNNFPMYDN